MACAGPPDMQSQTEGKYFVMSAAMYVTVRCMTFFRTQSTQGAEKSTARASLSQGLAQIKLLRADSAAANLTSGCCDKGFGISVVRTCGRFHTLRAEPSAENHSTSTQRRA